MSPDESLFALSYYDTFYFYSAYSDNSSYGIAFIFAIQVNSKFNYIIQQPFSKDNSKYFALGLGSISSELSIIDIKSRTV